jgi:multidrug resistance efflux pump
MGAAAASILAFAVVLGIPWIRETLNTVSTDDAYVNGHGGPRAWSGVQGSGG